MTAEIKKFPVEPVDHSLFECPECKGKFQREPYMPAVYLSATLDVRLVSMTFAFECPHCDVEIHVTFPSEREKAPVVPIRGGEKERKR